jgi:hypothetical protein
MRRMLHRATLPADVLKECVGRFKDTVQEDASLAALRLVERIYVSDEVILYETTVFAKSRSIGQLGKRRIPAHPTRWLTMIEQTWSRSVRITFRPEEQNEGDKNS